MDLRIRELAPDLWPDVEALFGGTGACGGCWCMHWRLERGEDWDALKGDENKRRFKALVERGGARGLLAYDGARPVGWAALGRKREFARLARSPSLRSDDADVVWSLPCFYIHAEYRGQGVATALLDAALATVEREGGGVVEGYPTMPTSSGKLPAAFAWTGVPAIFERAGFERVDARAKGKVRMRREV